MDRSGDIVAYVFPYALGRREFPDTRAIFDAVAVVREKHREASGEVVRKPRRFYNEVEQAVGRFGSVYVSASRKAPPILGATYSLHPYFLRCEEAQRAASRRPGSDTPRLNRIFFLGVDEEYFEFVSAGEQTLVHALSLKPTQAETVLHPSRIGKVTTEVQPSAREEWERILSLQPAGIKVEAVAEPHTETVISNWKLIPVVDWTWWCVPTAQTMLVGFWDNYVKSVGSVAGFGNLFGYWFDHSSGTNVPDFIDTLIDPSTKLWRQAPGGGGYSDLADFIKQNYGYSFTSPSTSVSANDDYGWSLLKSEIAAGRPLVWGTSDPNHATLAFGYREGSTGKFVVIYTTWGETATQQREVWSHALGDGFLRLIPSGSTGSDNLALDSPDGGEKLYQLKPTYITWVVWGSQIQTVDVDVSTDGGKTWSSLLKGYPTKAGTTAYQWLPATATTKGRVRLKGYSKAGTLIAGDGSLDNFTVSTASLDTWSSSWSSLGNPLQGSKASSGGIECYDVGRDASGNLQIVSAATDGSIWTMYESKGAWTGWKTVGRPAGNVFLRQLAVHLNSDNLLQVLALGDDGAVWTCSQSSASQPTTLSQWESLGKPTGQKLSTLVVDHDQDGTLRVFVLVDGEVWGLDRPRGRFARIWATLGGPSGKKLYTLSVGRNQDGRLELFAGGGSASGEFGLTGVDLWSNRETQTNSNSFDGWTSINSPTQKSATYPAVGTNKDGRLELFGVGNDGVLYHMPQLSASGSWGKWWTLNAPTSGTKLLARTVAASTFDSRIAIFAIGMSGTGPSDVITRTWYISQKTAGGAYDTWTGLGSQTSAGPGVPSGKSLDDLRVGMNVNGKLGVFGVSSEDKSLWWIYQK